MAIWYVKNLSRLMRVSVRTLHYYDKIGLLKPSGRLANGYRVYFESDVHKLEKIIALKFFGFTLSHIQMLLREDTNTLRHLHSQLQIIQAEVSYLENTQRALLSRAIEELESQKTVSWSEIVKIIGTYDKMNAPASKESDYIQTAESAKTDEVFIEKDATQNENEQR